MRSRVSYSVPFVNVPQKILNYNLIKNSIVWKKLPFDV